MKNLLATLLKFAASEKPREEDPITEVLAWLLEREPALLDAFRGCVERSVRARGSGPLPARRPAISTQLVVPRTTAGTARYDLVLDDPIEPLRIVVELKVSSGLTMSGAPKDPLGLGAPAEAAAARHQVHDYLAIAEQATTGSAYVLTLAVGYLDIGSAARGHRCYGGHVTWQDVYDAFAACLRDRALATAFDPAARLLTEQFLSVMETRDMAAPRLTFDGITSVHRYLKFRKSLDPILTHVHDTLIAEGAFDGFAKYQERGWQEAHGRIGYRFWVSKESTGFFAFAGIWNVEQSLQEGVPDLCFFLEVPLKSEAAKKIDAHASEINAAIAALNASDPRIRWGYSPDRYQRIWVAKSLADVAGANDPRDATLTFFRDVVREIRERGLMKIYLDSAAGLK